MNMSSTAARKRCLAAIVADLTPLMKTKAGWCLQEGMNHVIKANGGALAPVIQKEGVPLVYQTQKKNPCDDGIQNGKNLGIAFSRFVGSLRANNERMVKTVERNRNR
eukprot:CAMPEP_0204617344 /NCGR_PEP_ID=MMETSP0717-20131115/4353_1 /ASSEMBLY_ACC=CAM_ASM_000666 /TAXON_ID=230516 /ORGANISM="Chaetoceros curvisetus" /LENGTH=106 /DNA_ID=CAMNT_0051630853 /DNA_START=96 /DNA_END=414 /DNA_ORIENTATION=+